MYFSWDAFIFKNWKHSKRPFQVVIAPRNVGKTYATFEYVFHHGGYTPNCKVVYFRNTKTELQKAVADLNNKYKNQLIFSSGLVYNTKPVTVKEDGETFKVFKKNEVVGYYASLNDYQNSKGLEAKDVTYFIYDEFNEDSIVGRNLYFKFCNVVKTFERFNRIKYFFVLGNKDGVDNDFYLNWDIVPNHDYTKDNITLIKDFGVCYDLAEYHFQSLNNSNTLANRLMALDNRTKQYGAGGYGVRVVSYVKKFKDLIPTFKLMFRLAIDDNNYYLGTTQFGYTILSPWNYSNSDMNIKTYAVGMLGGLEKSSIILDHDNYNDLIDFLFKNEKHNQLFYDSYDTRQKIRDVIYFYTNILKK